MANDREAVLQYLGDVSTDLEKLKDMLAERKAPHDVQHAIEAAANSARQLLTKVEQTAGDVADEPVNGVSQAVANLIDFVSARLAEDPGQRPEERELLEMLSITIESAMAGSIWCM